MTVPQSGPTQSSASNHIIHLAEAVLAGAAPPESLATAVSTSLQGLEQAERDFRMRVAQLEVASNDGVKAAGSDVRAAFREYRGALEAFYHGPTGCDATRLNGAITGLALCTTRMLTALATFELQELSAIGPTDNPYVNFLLRIVSQFDNGMLSPVDYQALITQVAGRQAESYAPVLANFEAEGAEEAAALRQADAEHAGAITAFAAYATSHDRAALEKATADLQAVLSRINDLVAHGGMRRLAAGPSRSPHANVVRNVLSGFAQGALPLSSWENAVSGFSRVLVSTRAELDAVPESSSAVHEDVERARARLAALDSLVESMAGCRTPADAGRLMERLDEFSSQVDALLDQFDAIRGLQEQGTKVLCPRCNAYSAAGASTCEHCQARLPRFGTDVQSSLVGVREGGAERVREMPVPPPVRALFEAVNEIAEGKITAGVFERAVDDVHRLIDRNESDTEALAEQQKGRVAASDLDEEERERALSVLERALAQVLEGSGAIRHGLDRMRGFVHSRNREDLADAVRQVYAGFLRLYEVHLASSAPLADSGTPHIPADAAKFTVTSTDYSLTVSAEVDEDDGAPASTLLRGLFDHAPE